MKTTARIVIELVGPALLGTAFLFIWRHDNLIRISDFSFRAFGGYLIVAYAFAILPSLVYAFVMERWLKRRSVGDRAVVGTTVLSTLVGLAAGYAVHLASEAPVTLIGALVGLILGAILSLSAPNEKMT